MTVAGIVSHIVGPWNGFNQNQVAIVPQRFANTRTSYLIRAEPGQRDVLMPQVETLLAERESGRILEGLRTMEDIRRRSYELDGALVNILVFTIALLVAITTLGVGGLTSFNVTRRTKQIGVRRALGATRGAILRYFLAENLLITAVGVALGTVLSVVVNMALVEMFSIPRFSWYLLPAGMAALVGIGQLAVLIPARRAARVPPVVATRTV
jgi:putative ABC transport system permease protein